MLNNKKIVTFLCFLFVVLSINSFGNSIGENKHSEKTEALSQNSHSNNSENIVSLIGVLQPCIKLSESNNFTFQSFKNGKKYFSHDLSYHLDVIRKSFYVFYCAQRINSVKTSPFYIAYHRLLI